MDDLPAGWSLASSRVDGQGFVAIIANARVIARIDFFESATETLIANVVLGPELMESGAPHAMMRELLATTAKPLHLMANAGPDARPWWNACISILPGDRYGGARASA